MAPTRRRTITKVVVLLSLGALVIGMPPLPPVLLYYPIQALHPRVRWLTTGALASLVREPHAAVLLDARGEDEFAVSHLRSARRIDPDAPLLDRIAPDQPLVVYCSVGWRSALAIEAMPADRALRAFNLEGGLFAWANEGRELVRGGRRVHDVHPYSRPWALFLADELQTYTPRGAS